MFDTSTDSGRQGTLSSAASAIFVVVDEGIMASRVASNVFDATKITSGMNVFGSITDKAELG
jgi:hypothetical protein